MIENCFGFIPFFNPMCEKPPTVFSILESIVNPDVDLNDPEPEVKIRDLAKMGRYSIFNFDYPLSQYVDREKFETQILNHYLMRRIGFETVTAFRIALDCKLNEIMPIYNKMFNALENWDIFSDGESTERNGTDNSTNSNTNESENSLSNSSETITSNISDRRNSELPQSQLQNLRDGSYVTNYNYDTNSNTGTDESNSRGTSSSSTNGTNNRTYNETVTKTVNNKIEIMKEMQSNIKSIYTLIYNDLDSLFYQLG